MPKSWYELKTELRLQILGIKGLIHDFKYRRYNHVELYKLPNHVAVITGGNRGIGLEVVKKLLECEMTVIVGCRDPKSAQAKFDLTNTKGKLICEKLDVSSKRSIQSFAKTLKQSYNKIDILINNAGIMFAPYEITDDGFESHFVTNYLGHFMLTHLLLPQLKEAGAISKNARIINVSSLVHLIGRIDYKNFNGNERYYPATAYNQSKLAQVLFSCHLNKLLFDQNAFVQVHAVHPGVVDTDLFAHSSTTAVPGLKRILFKTPEEGSRSIVFAAIDKSLEGKGGTYLSNCRFSKTHPDAEDQSQCKLLFSLSCDLLNIIEFGKP